MVTKHECHGRGMSFVEGYYRKDGTLVRSHCASLKTQHYRTRSNSDKLFNFMRR